MKLSIRDNSVRLRLARSEVDTLRDCGEVVARTGFPGVRVFQYRIESSPASVNPAALFSDNIITVRWPEAEVTRWADSEQDSLRGEQTLDNGDLLTILVEKDFACLTPRQGEDELDRFPHPDAFSGTG